MRLPNELLTTMAAKAYYEKLRGIYGSNLIWFPALLDKTGTVCTDYSGNSRVGTYTGTVQLANAAGPDGTFCPLFNGTDMDVIPTVGTLAALNTAGVFNAAEITLGVWFKFSNVSYLNDAFNHVMFCVGAAATNRILLYKPTTANTIQALYRANSVNRLRVLDAAFTSVTWHHILMTSSDSLNVFRAYLDGVQVGADQTHLDGWAGALTNLETAVGNERNVVAFFPGWLIYPFLTNCFSTPVQAAAAARVG